MIFSPSSERILGFDNMVETIHENRSIKKLDREIANKTWARIQEGTFEKPELIVIKLQSTDIVWLYRDGSEVVNCDAHLSATTIDRISSYSRGYVTTLALPTVNGFRPANERVEAFCCGGIAVRAKGKIRIKPDGKIDLSTVSETPLEVIAKPKVVRQATRHLSKVARQVEIRRKLGAYDDIRSPTSRFFVQSRDTDNWLLSHIDKRIEDIDFDSMPDDAKVCPCSASGFTYDTARLLKATTILKVKILPTESVVL